MVSTNKGRKFFISAISSPSDLSQVGFEALTWVQIIGVSEFSDIDSTEEMKNYFTLEKNTPTKFKGKSNLSDMVLTVARESQGAGQVLLRSLAKVKTYHAVKFEHSDLTGEGSNTIEYSRSLVSGPNRIGGVAEDFDLEAFTFGLVQDILTVELNDLTEYAIDGILPTMVSDFEDDKYFNEVT